MSDKRKIIAATLLIWVLCSVWAHFAIKAVAKYGECTATKPWFKCIEDEN